MLINLLYYFFAILAAVGAIVILLTSNIFYAMLGLIFVVICLSALYVVQGAPFIAIIQLILHAGGILVLLICSLFFFKPTLNNSNKKEKKRIYRLIAAGTILLSLSVFFRCLCIPVAEKFAVPDSNMLIGTVDKLGYQLLGPYGVILELTSILLLVGLVAILHIMAPKLQN